MLIGVKKLPRSFNLARARLSLATCSVVLVLLAASVYAVSVPGVFSQDSRSALLMSLLSGEVDLEQEDQTVTEASSSSSSPAYQTGSLAAAPTLGQSPLMAAFSPVLEQTVNQVKEDPTFSFIAANDSSQSNSTQENPSQDSPVTEPNQPADETPTVAVAPVFDDETEAAFHAHILKYYNGLKTDYNTLCASLNTLYADLDSAEANRRAPKTTPVDAESYIWELDKKRVASSVCTYKDKEITSDSKWFDAYVNTWRAYESLENVASAIRDSSRVNGGEARKILVSRSNSSGKLLDLVEFERRYAQIRL